MHSLCATFLLLGIKEDTVDTEDTEDMAAMEWVDMAATAWVDMAATAWVDMAATEADTEVTEWDM
jgi:hypothetical protein